MQRSGMILVTLLLLALLCLGLYAACGSNGGTKGEFVACVRDVAIIVLMLETFVVTLLLLLIVRLFAALVSTIHDETLPILASAKRTVDTVQGTTTFVSNSLVAPLIGIAGLGSAIKGTIVALFSRKQRRS
jgi:hypothetical protein